MTLDVVSTAFRAVCGHFDACFLDFLDAFLTAAPLLGPKRVTFFSGQETYGAQPPIEILRQMIDQRAYPESGGWYDRKDVTHPFRSIIDVLLFAAMGPPGGGRTFITPRRAVALESRDLAKAFQLGRKYMP